MTKLENKLIELGYKKVASDRGLGVVIFKKGYREFTQVIRTDFEILYITYAKIDHSTNEFIFQSEIDDLQIAFNRLKSDIKEVENVTTSKN